MILVNLLQFQLSNQHLKIMLVVIIIIKKICNKFSNNNNYKSKYNLILKINKMKISMKYKSKIKSQKA